MPATAILGPGGVGGFLAAALARAGQDVVVVAREPTAELIARDGIEVSSARLGDFHARPTATPMLEDEVDALIVATKATGLEQSLERVVISPPLVVPLLNGLDHLSALRTRFASETVAAGVIRIESDRPVPGRIVQTSPLLRVDLASEHPALADRLKHLASRLKAAGVPVHIGASESQVMWSKLVRLCALALTTSAYDTQLGAIRSEHRATLEACVGEAAAVATADGAAINPAATMAELDEAHPSLGSSMQRDIAAGREPELDAIAGSVLRAAARHGLQCATIERLAEAAASRAGVEAP